MELSHLPDRNHPTETGGLRSTPEKMTIETTLIDDQKTAYKKYESIPER